MPKNIRYAFRVLRKNPVFTLVAVCSLAIGIGATSAIFSLADALLLRPLPVLKPTEVVTLRVGTAEDPFAQISYKDYVDFRDRNRTFDGLVAYALAPLGVSEQPEALPQLKYGFFVSGNFFRAMGVEPVLGRGFRADEDVVPGRDAVVVLSHDFWTSYFGADPSVIGKRIRLNGVEFIIIGVAPKQFTGMDQYLRPALYVPIAMAEKLGNPGVLEKRDARWLTVKGRLKPGVSLEQAQADIASLAKALERMYPGTNRDQRVQIKTELQARIEQSPPDADLIAMLMTLALCVLLVACANVAGLLLSRSRARLREIAVRLAIGAGRLQLIRQLLLESFLIALLGGCAGVAVAYGGVKFLDRIQIPTDLPLVFSIQLDHRVLLFTVIVSVASTILFGLTPAIRTSRPDLVPALKAAAGETSKRRRLWVRNLLVISQVAISLVLLTVSALMYRGFETVFGRGPGYRTDHLLMMSFNPELVRYTQSQTQQFYKQLLDRVRSTPGVKSAALCAYIPMGPGQGGEDVAPEGYQFPAGQHTAKVLSNTISDEYFETMGIPIVRGRPFLKTDTPSAPLVAIVNEELAKRYWPNQDAVGKRFRLSNAAGPWVQIIGIAKTTKYLWIAEPPLEFLYLPLSQHPESQMTLMAQSQADAASLVPALREVVRGLDPNQPIYGVRTMKNFYEQRAVKTAKIVIQTIAAMGLMGLTLAMIGLYGLVAYSVSSRTREIGIRMAIGANREGVLQMVLKQGLVLAIVGIAFGIAGSIVANRALNAIFSSTHEWSMTTGEAVLSFIAMPAIMIAVTLLATFAPARRASQVDPMKALRYE